MISTFDRARQADAGKVLQALKDCGCNVRLIIRDPSDARVCYVRVDESGEPMIFWFRGRSESHNVQ